MPNQTKAPRTLEEACKAFSEALNAYNHGLRHRPDPTAQWEALEASLRNHPYRTKRSA